MAGTSGLGSVGALTIGGVAATVVIVGGVVLMQLGVFTGNGAPQPPQEITQPANAPEPTADREAGAVEAQAKAPVTDKTVEVVAADPEPKPDAAEVPQVSSDNETVDDARSVETPEPPIPAPVEGAQEEASVIPEDGVETAKPDPADVATTAPVAALPAPEIDVIRFDTDGAGLIAGKAPAGARVLILLDGAVIEDLSVPTSGEFVSFPVVEPAGIPRVVTIQALDGTETVTSDVSFILAPTTAIASAEAPADLGKPVQDTPPVADKDLGEIELAVPEFPAPADEPVSEELAQVVQAERDAQPEPQNVPVTQTEGSLAGSTGSEPAQATTAAPSTSAAATPQAEGAAKDVGIETAGATNDQPQLANTQPAAIVQSQVAAPVAPVQDVPTKPLAAVSGAAQTEADRVALLQTNPKADAPVSPQTEEPAATEVDPAPKPSPTGIAVLRAGPDGIEVVQSAVPTSPELADKVALDAISYTQNGDVVLDGRARPAALVRVYIDNSPVADIGADVNGRWRIRLDDVAPGIYTLRLDEIDPLEGKVLSRLETPFKREAPDVLTQPAAEAGQPEFDTSVRVITVQKGDSLWAISQDRYGDGFLFVKVFEANRNSIRNPDLIYPGQVFTLPE